MEPLEPVLERFVGVRPQRYWNSISWVGIFEARLGASRYKERDRKAIEGVLFIENVVVAEDFLKRVDDVVFGPEVDKVLLEKGEEPSGGMPLTYRQRGCFPRLVGCTFPSKLDGAVPLYGRRGRGAMVSSRLASAMKFSSSLQLIETWSGTISLLMKSHAKSTNQRVARSCCQ